MPTTAVAGVFTGNDQSGTSRFTGVPASDRVRRMSGGVMWGLGLYDKLSSARVFPSGATDATLILFDGKLFGTVNLGDFDGSFLQATNRAGSGQVLDVDQLSNFGFNNKARSQMLVAARRNAGEVRLSARNVLLSTWNAKLADFLAGTSAQQNGGPIITWDMFPANEPFLSSNRQYLKIHQRLKIVLSGWPDYDASVTYWIFLFINGNGNIRGSVDRGSVWVEGGIKSGAILDELLPKAKAALDVIQTEIDNMLGQISQTFSEVYLLPGNQVDRAKTGVMTGSTWDDTTIVID